MTKSQNDLAGVEYWNEVSQGGLQDLEYHLHKSYQSFLLVQELLDAVQCSAAQTVLEVGCGNSVWLPYLARNHGLKVARLDYSEAACELARRQLQASGQTGQIFCRDLFQTTAADVGQYDLVYSLGVVEHFGDVEAVLMRLLGLVKPGGYLLTEVPNLNSVHGLLSAVWQPEVYAMHQPLTKRRLLDAYDSLELEHVEAHFAGVFSLGIVAWEQHPRWPRLAKVLMPTIWRVVSGLDVALRPTRLRRGLPALAPYLCILGRRPAEAR